MPPFSSLLFAAVTLQGPSRGAAKPRTPAARSVSVPGLPSGVDLYSLRERRRLASLLRLRLLELRKADLERVSRALEERLGGFAGPAPPTQGQ